MAVLLSEIRERMKADLAINGTTYDAQIDDSIRSALRSMRGKRYWFLKRVATVTLLTSASSVSLPSDFAAPGDFYMVDGGIRFGQNNGFQYYSDYDAFTVDYAYADPLPTGRPEAFYIINGVMYFSNVAPKDYTITLSYFCKDADLPEASDTSVWFDDGYDVIRSTAMFIFKRDSKDYTPSEEDGSMAALYLNNLDNRNTSYVVG